jgi:hypothetical protein
MFSYHEKDGIRQSGGSGLSLCQAPSPERRYCVESQAAARLKAPATRWESSHERSAARDALEASALAWFGQLDRHGLGFNS